MTRRLFDLDAMKECDLQLDMELEGTFPASDPLKITRFSVAMHNPRLKTIRLTSPRSHGSRVRTTAAAIARPREDFSE